MERDFFSRLPPEIVAAILSRLSVRGVARSKCVCKPWLDLLCSDDFVNSYRSKSAALAVLIPVEDLKWCRIFEIGDELGDPEGYNPIAEFDFPHSGATLMIGGSVNGLLLLHHRDANVDVSYICNPITREFVEIHFDFREEQQYGRRPVAYGFGASNVSGEYKLVRIDSWSGHCHVYTLGTRRWRRVGAAGAAASSLRFDYLLCYGAFLNGNLYWKVVVSDSGEYETLIAWFDLEKECLGTFECPPPIRESDVEVFTLRDRLSYWDESDEGEIVIWVMKECGIEKSWRKEYVIDHPPGFGFVAVRYFQTIKAFENGDLLVLSNEWVFFYYSIKTKTYQEIPSFGACGRGGDFIDSLLLTPSFRSLKSFGMEDVISF